MQTKERQKNIPKLRFPGFFGEWGEKRLGEVFKVGSGKDYKHLKAGNIPVFGTSGYMLSVDKALHGGETVFIGRKGTINKPFYYNGDFWTVDTLFYTYDFKNVIPKFINFIFQQINWLKYNEASGVPSLSKTTIERIKINTPSLPEQQKIAEFLGVVDEWIGNLRAQKESLEKYKKGMMQKIFSQEIRFKDENGNNFSEWEEKRLGEVGDIITGATPSTSNAEYYSGNFPWITPTDINNQKDIYGSARFLTKKGLEKGRFIPKNSLLVTCIASIGKNAILRVNGSCNQQINAIIPNKKNNVEFLYYLVEKNKNIFIRFAGAGGMQILNKADFSGVKFKIPLLPEQEKIAEFLTSIDNLIESKQQQITQAEQWKKGLMQRLFV